jgi:hypothetical protein
MSNPSPTLDPWRALTHPAWWCALGLLALNDHVLKGSGILPGAVTGKLSDFAGMVVAPVLAAALLGARSRRAVAMSFALVAAGFAAIKVSQAASALYVGALAGIGFSGRNVVDPTDLVALAALPLAWRLCAVVPSGSRRVAVQRLAVALGGIACVATSPATPSEPVPGQWMTSAILANTTSNALEVRLRWIDGRVACTEVGGDARGVFLRSAFTSEPLTVLLTAGQTFPLTRAEAFRAIMPTPSGASAPAPTETVGCDAVLVQADNLPSVVVWLSGNTTFAPVRWGGGGGLGLAPVAALLLEGEPTSLTARGTNGLVTAPPADAPSACGEPTTRYFVAGDASLWNNLPVASVRVQPDGCTRLGSAGTAAMTLCIPEDAVPFRVGDVVTAFVTDRVWTIRAERGAQLLVVPSMPYNPNLPGLNVRVLPTACLAHTACGAYLERAGLFRGDEALPRNERIELGGSRAYFGGAERVIVSPSACGSASPVTAPFAPLLNLAIVTGL